MIKSEMKKWNMISTKISAPKTSAFLSWKIHKNEYLTDEEIYLRLPSNLR